MRDELRRARGVILSDPLHIVMRCNDRVIRKARYVFDTLFMAIGVRCVYVTSPVEGAPWILYAPSYDPGWAEDTCIGIAHVPQAWEFLDRHASPAPAPCTDGLIAPFAERMSEFEGRGGIGFDLVANAFFLLASWSERLERSGSDSRQLFANSIYVRAALPRDLVDRYLSSLRRRYRDIRRRQGMSDDFDVVWPGRAEYAVVLSHDVDFLPRGLIGAIAQAGKTMLRHAIRERNPVDAVRAGSGFVKALASGRDAYGCVPEIIAEEKRLGVRSSFQVAVGHRHPADVNYHIEDDHVRRYLKVIPESGFDLCLHGSYRSTEVTGWYVEEVETLSAQLGRPRGSRQHFLSFDYDNLFAAQEATGIQYDMSMGYPDNVGSRTSFSHPYFPYCIAEDRPYDVVQISLALMDVTLRSYMGLRGMDAWPVVKGQLEDLRRVNGGVSVVWHPIVFGGARDPGSDELYWRIVEFVGSTNGCATDGRTVNHAWRSRALHYESFQHAGAPAEPLPAGN